jgi:uncharacterized membrane protein
LTKLKNSLIEKKRVWELDFLRGLALLLMLLDHLMYDFSEMYNIFVNFFDAPDFLWKLMNLGEWWFYESVLRKAGHYVFAFVFLLVTGISYALSKDNGKRCIKLWCMAIILSLATMLIDSFAALGATVYFGVLQCMALGLTLNLFIDKVIKNDYVLLFTGAAIIITGIVIRWYEMPWRSVWYVCDFRSFMEVALGFVRVGGDHFGIFPSLGVVLVGAYLGKTFYREKRSLLPSLDGRWNKAFCFVGQRTGWIYLLHQPVLMALVVVFGLMFGMELF